jgi:hypothetical protein
LLSWDLRRCFPDDGGKAAGAAFAALCFRYGLEDGFESFAAPCLLVDFAVGCVDCAADVGREVAAGLLAGVAACFLSDLDAGDAARFLFASPRRAPIVVALGETRGGWSWDAGVVQRSSSGVRYHEVEQIEFCNIQHQLEGAPSSSSTPAIIFNLK